MSHFFVSYTEADRQWAEWIAWQLEAKHHTVTIQAWDFAPGDNFIQRMRQASSEAQRTIAVLSPAYLRSVFGQAEWNAALLRDPLGSERRLIPVRVAPLDLDPMDAGIVYVDLVGVAPERAATVLLKGVLGARLKPATEPPIPSSPSGPEREAPSFPGEADPSSPTLWYTDAMVADEVSIVFALEALEAGTPVSIRWPPESDRLLESWHRVVAEARGDRARSPLFRDWPAEDVLGLLEFGNAFAADRIAEARMRVERRLVPLVASAAPYFGSLRRSLHRIVRNYLTLANHNLHSDLAYRLMHDRLPRDLVPDVWRDLVQANFDQWRGGPRRLLGTQGWLIHARVARFADRFWDEYVWGPAKWVADAAGPGAFGTDWIVEYVIPQLELRLAFDESAEILPYSEGISVSKATVGEHGDPREVDLFRVRRGEWSP